MAEKTSNDVEGEMASTTTNPATRQEQHDRIAVAVTALDIDVDRDDAGFQRRQKEERKYQQKKEAQTDERQTKESPQLRSCTPSLSPKGVFDLEAQTEQYVRKKISQGGRGISNDSGMYHGCKPNCGASAKAPLVIMFVLLVVCSLGVAPIFEISYLCNYYRSLEQSQDDNDILEKNLILSCIILEILTFIPCCCPGMHVVVSSMNLFLDCSLP